MTPDRNERGIIRRIFSYWREIAIIILLFFSISCMNKIGETVEVEQVVVKQETVKVNKMQPFDKLSFNEAFSQMYTMYGEGYIFDWRGNVYLTKLAE